VADLHRSGRPGGRIRPDDDGNAIECISLKQGATGDDEILLRVNLPERHVQTSFAKIIGIDTLSVGAFAIAEIASAGQATVLPLSLPEDFGTEECLGTPPSGQLLDGEELSVCIGPKSGNFGLLDSPFFESHEINGSPENGCHSNPYPNANTRAPFNLAAGLDHPIQLWAEDGPIPTGDLGNKADGADTCDADIEPDPEMPYVLGTQTGNRDLIQGLIGATSYDSTPSRLRQSSPENSEAGGMLAFEVQGGSSFALDNVGLWEYLAEPKVDASFSAPASCFASAYGGTGYVGKQATEAIINCLTETRDDPHVTPEFTKEILLSPRFALVPVLSYKKGDITGLKGTEWRAVVELIPVYLQTAWFDCGNGKDPWCRFNPEKSPSTPTSSTSSTTGPPDPTEGWSVLFSPGEGTTSPMVLGGGVNPSLEQPKTVWIEGITALVIEWDWLLDGAKNQLGGNVPLTVSLYR
jgi:hypothetical protein